MVVDVAAAERTGCMSGSRGGSGVPSRERGCGSMFLAGGGPGAEEWVDACGAGG